MAKYEGNDHYLDPETGILKNKLGIKEEDELNEAEASKNKETTIKPILDNDDIEILEENVNSLAGC